MIFYKDSFRQIRKAKKLSYRKIADYIGKSLNTVYNWESGIHSPSLSDIHRLSELFKIPVSDLCDSNEQAHLPVYYNNLDNLDKSIYELSRKSESERQKLIIGLLNKEKTLRDEILNYKKKINDHSALLNSVNNIIYRKDASLKYSYVNQFFLNFFGLYDNFNVIGRRNKDVWFKFDGWTELTKIEELVLKTKQEIESEIIPIPKSFASASYGKVNVKPIVDKDSNVTGIIGTIYDITGEKVIIDKFAYIEAVLENIEHVIWISKSVPYRHFIFINDAVNNIYESKKHNFYNNPDYWFEFLHKDDVKRIKKDINNKANNLKYKITLNDGSIKWINHFISTTVINNEEIEFSIVRDVTKETESKKMIEIMSSGINHMNEGFCLFSSGNNDHIFVNKARENIYGYPMVNYQKQGAKFWFENCLHPDDLEIEQKYHNNKSWPEIREFKIIKPDGSIRLIEARVTKFEYFGEFYYSFIDQDITERRNLLEELRNINKTFSYNSDVVWYGTTSAENNWFNYSYITSNTYDVFEINFMDLQRKSLKWIELVTDKDIDKVEKWLSISQYPKEIEFRILTRSNTMKYIYCSIKKEDDTYYGCFYDISKWKTL
jgi:PAS domain S-box-containing protein